MRLRLKAVQKAKVSRLVFTTRQIITIMPDFGGAYAWINRSGDLTDGRGGCCANWISDWGSGPIISKQLRLDFEDWQSGFESADWQEFRVFDWDGFNRRGLALTVRLKSEVGEAALVIYEKAYEDPNCRIEELREVLQDGQFRVLLSRRMEKLRKDKADA